MTFDKPVVLGCGITVSYSWIMTAPDGTKFSPSYITLDSTTKLEVKVEPSDKVTEFPSNTAWPVTYEFSICATDNYGLEQSIKFNLIFDYSCASEHV